MAKKKKNRGHSGAAPGMKRLRSNRSRVVLSIVATDITFELINESKNEVRVWIGKCIHCNRKLCVSQLGQTDATVEHIVPLCGGGNASDPRNLSLACKNCNNEKGIRHDKHAGKGGRADQVISALSGRRLSRWREPVTTLLNTYVNEEDRNIVGAS